MATVIEQIMKYLSFILLIFLCSCTTVRHKNISHTYHGTNGNGGHWTVWRIPNKISNDSVIVYASGFNVSRQKKVMTSTLAILSKKDTVYKMNETDYESISIKLAAGRYQLLYAPTSWSIRVRTRFINLHPGDSIALHANVVLVDRYLHENWNAKYMTPKQKARDDRRKARYIARLDKLAAKDKMRKYFRLRERKSKRWPLQY